MLTQTIQLYRNAFQGLSKPAWYLSLVMLINRSGSMVIPFMTMYCSHQLGFTVGQAGFIMAIFGVGAIMGGLLGGKLTDLIGHYPVQLAALIGGGMMFILLGQMRSFTSIAVCTFLLSLLNESFRPANATAIANYSKEENRTRSYALNRLAINVGWAVGSALGGFLASFNYSYLFWVDGLTNIGAAVFMLLVLPLSASKAATKKNASTAPPVMGASAYKDRTYLLFIFFTILFAFSFFQLFTMLPLYYKNGLHLSERFIGIVMAANGLIIAAFEMVLIFKLEGKRAPLAYVPIGTLLVALSYIVFNLLPGTGWLAFFSMLIVTAGEMLSMPFMNSFWISRSTAQTRGQYAGLYTVAWSVAQVLSPAFGALLVEKGGFTVLWWVVGGIALLAAMGYRWLHRQ
jgi:predicted MFS family arabinose efflux permease